MPVEETTHRTSLWLIPVVLLVVACAVVGGMAARQFYAGPSAKPEPVPATSPAGTPSSHEAGTPILEMSADANVHPLHAEVQGSLQGFFYSINNHSYLQWKTFVSAKLSAQTTETTWTSNYSTTTDTDIKVLRINGNQTGAVTVLLSFTSNQSIAQAPAQARSTCDHWWVVWPMVREQDSLKVDVTISQTPPVQTCA